MTLYTHKDSNIRKTWTLFALFLIVVIGFGWVISRAYGNPGILYIAVIFAVFMNVLSYWYSDKIVLAMTHARRVEDKDIPDLYNIVENLAITAGLPMPKVYLVSEAQPNAFATGRDPEHAVIAVTEGLLARLNRAELEGVIAHEMSHIGNRDILFSTVIVVLVGFISILADIFLRTSLFRSRDSENRGNNIFVIIGFALAILAPISATLMQLAISRKREFLADASGALLTRYPDGLASALEKISRDTMPMSVANNTTSHLWLDDPFNHKTEDEEVSWFHKIFMTHPPINERINALRGMKV